MKSSKSTVFQIGVLCLLAVAAGAARAQMAADPQGQQRQGHGVEQLADGGVGEGPYVDGKRHGDWVLRLANGSVEEGPYVDGHKHGHWVLRHANGDVREGPYVNGRKHGDWVLRFANGDVEEGPYVDGRKHGDWVLRYANGDVQEGPVVDGRKHGDWVLRFADGDVQEGPFADGEQHGDWIWRKAGGKLYKGTFARGTKPSWERVAELEAKELERQEEALADRQAEVPHDSKNAQAEQEEAGDRRALSRDLPDPARTQTAADLEDQLCPDGNSGDCYIKLDSPENCHFWSGGIWKKDGGERGDTITWSGACDSGLVQGEGTLVLKNWRGDLLSENMGAYVDGKPHGDWVERHAHGNVDVASPHVAEGPYADGKRHGDWVFRLADGDVYEGPYVDGKRHGDWVVRYASGSAWEVPYADGEMVGGYLGGKQVAKSDKQRAEEERQRLAEAKAEAEAAAREERRRKRRERQRAQAKAAEEAVEEKSWVTTFTETALKATEAYLEVEAARQQQKNTLQQQQEAANRLAALERERQQEERQRQQERQEAEWERQQAEQEAEEKRREAERAKRQEQIALANSVQPANHCLKVKTEVRWGDDTHGWSNIRRTYTNVCNRPIKFRFAYWARSLDGDEKIYCHRKQFSSDLDSGEESRGGVDLSSRPFNGPSFSTRISYQEKYSSIWYVVLSYDPDIPGSLLRAVDGVENHSTVTCE